MELSSLIPMSSADIKIILDGALDKMNNYCRSESIYRINSRYKLYLESFTFFRKKVSLIEWCGLKDTEWGYKTTKARKLSYTSNYNGFILETLRNAEMSSTGMLYLSDEDTKTLRYVKYRTTDNEVLTHVEKSKNENLELWNYLIEKKII